MNFQRVVFYISSSLQILSCIFRELYLRSQSSSSSSSDSGNDPQTALIVDDGGAASSYVAALQQFNQIQNVRIP
ncbi:hypothetical protein Nepgr_028668 [Nepenthes gracilis]|uniref:Uncharacterized protein n=1 Tax=Nepenthes gracilis TaxID=150966 RepID=A0AAD3TAR6_NEPGR|nr:hypothetical protein Nepgr_028668 [Nepenthes gracilis]